MSAQNGVQDDYNKPFAKNLRRLLDNEDDISPLNRKVTQSELADEICKKGHPVKRQTISLYKDGRAMPDIEKFKIIADFFDVSYDFLLGKSNSTKREYYDIAEKTGLSDESISALRLLKEQIDNNDNPAWRWRLKAINLIIAHKGEDFVSPIVYYVSSLLNEVDYIKKHDPGCWESIGQPSTLEALKLVLKENSSDGFDLERLYNEFGFAEWKLYEGQKAFAESIAAQMYNDLWKEKNHAERSED